MLTEQQSQAAAPARTSAAPSSVSGLPAELRPPPSALRPSTLAVALLTGGGDRPYALGMAEALTATGVSLDFIGSDELEAPELDNNPRVRFLNLRGEQRTDASFLRKARRIIAYYLRLVCYAATARPKIFHILWNNKFELFDRTFLMLFYRLLGKKVVFTAHNVNAGKRDATDSFLNRMSLKIQYRLAGHVFVHTRAMKEELMTDFAVPDGKISVIPFGLNSTVPNTALTPAEAKRQLGIGPGEKTLLFFGNIAPYKGLEFLIEAFETAAREDGQLQLVVAGRPKGFEDYWSGLLARINRSPVRRKMILKIEYVPDADTELYFKAADVLVLPYTHIFQSGVLFLGYNFGLPVLAADVGSLKEEIIEGKTGFVFPPKDPAALAAAIETYFASDLFQNLEGRRWEIRDYANERYSWAKVSAITTAIYARLNHSWK